MFRLSHKLETKKKNIFLPIRNSGFFQLKILVKKFVDLYSKKIVKTCRDLDIRKQINHHLHITLTEFSYPSEELEIYFSLYSTKENCYVSEKVLMPALPISENNDQGLFAIFILFVTSIHQFILSNPRIL